MATTARDKAPSVNAAPGHWLEVLAVFLRLGLTSFGGPVAHLGYFREEFVIRRRWLDDRSYADLVALCQFLPGPASSQVGIALGLLRGALRRGLGGLDRIHAAVGDGDDPVRLRHRRARRRRGLRLAAWPQGRRGCGRRPGRARHGAHARARSCARHTRRGGGHHRIGDAIGVGADRRHRCSAAWRACCCFAAAPRSRRTRCRCT